MCVCLSEWVQKPAEVKVPWSYSCFSACGYWDLNAVSLQNEYLFLTEPTLQFPEISFHFLSAVITGVSGLLVIMRSKHFYNGVCHM